MKPVFNVFYSWQSDLPECTGRSLIQSALAEASARLIRDHDLGVTVTIDEATKNRSGSPDIAKSIFDKIDVAGAFVCDLTTVMEHTPVEGDVIRVCNPNVAIELGYAIRVLGWDRIVLIVNEARGRIEDTPFDVRHHRALAYRCNTDLDGRNRPTPSCVSDIANATGLLRERLVEALKLIVVKNEPRPDELAGPRPETIRRRRDVAEIERLLNQVPLWLFDYYLDRLGYSYVPYPVAVLHEQFVAAMDSHATHFNDPALDRLFRVFYDVWKGSMSHTSNMDLPLGAHELRFVTPGDTFQSDEDEKAARELARSEGPLREALKSLLTYIRERYVEVDVLKITAETRARYAAEVEEARRRISQGGVS